MQARFDKCHTRISPGSRFTATQRIEQGKGHRKSTTKYAESTKHNNDEYSTRVNNYVRQ